MRIKCGASVKINKRQLRKIINEALDDEGINPGDGKLSGKEAKVMNQLASDAQDEEALESDDTGSGGFKFPISVLQGIVLFLRMWDDYMRHYSSFARTPWRHDRLTGQFAKPYDLLQKEINKIRETDGMEYELDKIGMSLSALINISRVLISPKSKIMSSNANKLLQELQDIGNFK